MNPVANNDSRHMHPLPWEQEEAEEGKCVTLKSASNKTICSFWGGDTRDPKNYEWCTREQMLRHANYATHALNHFPLMQQALEAIYLHPDLPATASSLIEEIMDKCYYVETPPMVATGKSL